MNADGSEMKQPEIEDRPGTTPAFPTRYLGFGEFQIDLQREEVWKSGARIRLQGKVYQTLLILLSRAGNVVTREEVRKHLWPDDPQVNFDANVNTSMNKLRQVLGDSPEEPIYIETIPRRGYSFVAPLEYLEALKAAGKHSGAAAKTSKGSASEGRGKRPQLPYSMPIGLRIATLLLAGMVAGSLLVLAWFSFSRSHRVLNSSRVTPCEQAAEPSCPHC